MFFVIQYNTSIGYSCSNYKESEADSFLKRIETILGHELSETEKEKFINLKPSAPSIELDSHYNVYASDCFQESDEFCGL